MFTSNIISNYDGLAILRTIDAEEGIVELMVSPGCEDQARAVMDSIARPSRERPKGNFSIITMGCQMNEYESEFLERTLLLLGWQEASSLEVADLVVVNTCSVRKKPELKALSLLGRLMGIKRQRRGMIIGMTGCLAEHKGEEIMKMYPELDFLIAPVAIAQFERVLKEVLEEKKRVFLRETHAIPSLPVCKVPRSKVTGFVSIMQGCNNFCSYCVVPYVRGPERSRDFREIIEEVRLLVSQGVKEITLLGQNVNSYLWHKERYLNFSDLLHMISGIDGLKRLRFTTSHPKDLSLGLIGCFTEVPVLCNHIHLPVQAGSNKILERMGRGYTRERYMELISKLRAARADIAITTDIMVGFPGETESDFQETIELVREVRFDMAFSFKYSDREGTKAQGMDGKIPEEEKLRRLQILQEIQRQITFEKNQEDVGKFLEILVEGKSKDKKGYMGRTTTNKIVNFPCNTDVIGRLLNVRITEACNNSLRGETSDIWGH